MEETPGRAEASPFKLKEKSEQALFSRPNCDNDKGCETLKQGSKMEKRVLIYPLLALALSSCSSEGEQDYAEVYLSEGCISTEPGSSSPDTYITIPQALLEVLKPEQENGTSEVYKDTLDLKTTITDYRLMIRNQSAELTVNIQAKMKAREMRRTANYYVFKAGRYDVNGTAVEVRDDGIYLEDGRNILELKNYRFVKSSENEVVSSSDLQP